MVRGGRVHDVDMSTTVHVTRAAFPTGTPRAVENSAQLFPLCGDTFHRFRDKVRRQSGYGWVHVQRHKEEQ